MSGCEPTQIDKEDNCKHGISKSELCGKCYATVSEITRQEETNIYFHEKISALEFKVKELEEHKNHQIDENRKLSRRVDELEDILNKIYNLGSQVRPVIL